MLTFLFALLFSITARADTLTCEQATAVLDPNALFPPNVYSELVASAERDGIDLNASTLDSLARIFDEGLQEYRRTGVYSDTRMEQIRQGAESALVAQGVAPPVAKALSKAWVASDLLLADTRFPSPPPELFTVTPALRDASERVRELFAECKRCETLPALMEHLTQKEKANQTFAEMFRGRPGDRIQQQQQQTKEDIQAVQMMMDVEKNIYPQIPSAAVDRKFPYGFRSKEQFEDFSREFVARFKKDMGEHARGIDTGNFRFFATGSSVAGLSADRKIERVLRRPYSSRSDLDMYVLVTPEQFRKLKGAYIQEADPGRSYDYEVKENRRVFEKLGLTGVLEEYQARIAGGAKKIAINFVTEDYMKRAQRENGAQYIELLP